MKIRHKLGVTSLGLTLIIIAMFLATWLVNRQQMNDGLIINLAGRQRMLSQKFTKEVYDENNKKTLIARARENATGITVQITADRAYYTKNVIGKLKKEWPDFKADQYYHDTEGAIPLPATFVQEVSEEINSSGQYRYELLSKWNINEEKGLKTEFQERAWHKISQSPAESYSEIAPRGAGETLAVDIKYAIADLASAPACVSCHNAHAESPKNDFALNDVMGVLVATVNITEDPVIAKAILNSQATNFQPVSDETGKLFETTLSALMNGGQTFSDLGMTKAVTIPGATNPDICTVLEKVEGLWGQLREATRVVKTADSQSAEYADYSHQLGALSLACLKSMNAAVGIMQKDSEARVSRLLCMQIILVCFGLAASVASALTVVSIGKRLDNVKEFAAKLGEGNLTATSELTGQDELGIIGNNLDAMAGSLRNMFTQISDNAVSLNQSSSGLSAISTEMSQGAEDVSNRSNTVAVASEEMSSNMNSVAAAMEQASTNISIVSSSTEQMTSSIGDIAQNTERASSVTAQAVTEAQSASAKVNELGKAADEIGEVTKTITEISEQTNLLALNATIEAARAGDAGKGFAVVANEIKELANQTADATEEIRSKIGGIQDSTSQTVTEIERITEVIGQVNDIVSTIASSVEEQSFTTREIAENVTQASLGISEVNENVAQTSAVAGEIAKDISQVNQASTEMSGSSTKVNSNASELSELSGQLEQMVGQFKV